MNVHDWLLNALRVDSKAVTLVTAEQIEKGIFEPCEIRLTSISPMRLHLYGQELKQVIQNGFVGKCRNFENSQYFSLGQEPDPNLSYIDEISPIVIVSNDPISFEKKWA
jgi:hypothetical protein